MNYDGQSDPDGPPQTMSVSNGSTGTTTGTVAVRHQAVDVAVDPSAQRVYVANSDHSVSVYNEASRTVVAATPTNDTSPKRTSRVQSRKHTDRCAAGHR